MGEEVDQKEREYLVHVRVMVSHCFSNMNYSHALKTAQHKKNEQCFYQTTKCSSTNSE